MLQRGASLLHACGFVLDGAVVAVAAASGTGKSTMAAWMHLHGFPAVTDDILAMPDADPDRVVPAYPLVKLEPDACTRLGLDADIMEVIEPDEGTRAFDLRPGFDPQPRPLGVILVFERVDDTGGVNVLEGSDRVMAVVSNSYGLSSLHAAGNLGRHLDHAARIANNVPVVRVRVPRERPIDDVGELLVTTARRLL